MLSGLEILGTNRDDHQFDLVPALANGVIIFDYVGMKLCMFVTMFVCLLLCLYNVTVFVYNYVCM